MRIRILGGPVKGRVEISVDPAQTFETIFHDIAHAVHHESRALWSTHDLHPAVVVCAQSRVLRPRRYTIRPSDTVASLNLQGIDPAGPRLLVLRLRQPFLRDDHSSQGRCGSACANKENLNGATDATHGVIDERVSGSASTPSLTPARGQVSHLVMRSTDRSNAITSRPVSASPRARKVTSWMCSTPHDHPGSRHDDAKSRSDVDGDDELFSMRSSPATTSQSPCNAATMSCPQMWHVSAPRVTVHASDLGTRATANPTDVQQGRNSDHPSIAEEEARCTKPKLQAPNAASSSPLARSFFALHGPRSARSEPASTSNGVCTTTAVSVYNGHSCAHCSRLLACVASFMERTQETNLARACIHSWLLYCHIRRQSSAAGHSRRRDVRVGSTDEGAQRRHCDRATTGVATQGGVCTGDVPLPRCCGAAELRVTVRRLCAELLGCVSDGGAAADGALSRIMSTGASVCSQDHDATYNNDDVVYMLNLCTRELQRQHDHMAQCAATKVTAVSPTRSMPDQSIRVLTLSTPPIHDAVCPRESHDYCVDQNRRTILERNEPFTSAVMTTTSRACSTISDEVDHEALVAAPTPPTHSEEYAVDSACEGSAPRRAGQVHTSSTPLQGDDDIQRRVRTKLTDTPTPRPMTPTKTTAGGVVACCGRAPRTRRDTMSRSLSHVQHRDTTQPLDSCDGQKPLTRPAQTRSVRESMLASHRRSRAASCRPHAAVACGVSRSTTPMKARRGMLSEPFALCSRPDLVAPAPNTGTDRTRTRSSVVDRPVLPIRNRASSTHHNVSLRSATEHSNGVYAPLRIAAASEQPAVRRGSNARAGATVPPTQMGQSTPSSPPTAAQLSVQDRGLCMVCSEHLTACSDDHVAAPDEQAALCLACYRVYTFAELAARDRILGL